MANILNEIILKDEERQTVECWTRVMGYFHLVSDFNKGKGGEFNERKWFVKGFIVNRKNVS